MLVHLLTTCTYCAVAFCEPVFLYIDDDDDDDDDDGLQWRLATKVAMSSNECQNIVSAMVTNFEECGITLLQTRILTETHVSHETIRTLLDEIRSQSRGK